MKVEVSLHEGIRTNPNKYRQLRGNLSQISEQGGGGRENFRTLENTANADESNWGPRQRVHRGSMAQLGVGPFTSWSNTQQTRILTPTLRKHL